MPFIFISNAPCMDGSPLVIPGFCALRAACSFARFSAVCMATASRSLRSAFFSSATFLRHLAISTLYVSRSSFSSSMYLRRSSSGASFHVFDSTEKKKKHKRKWIVRELLDTHAVKCFAVVKIHTSAQIRIGGIRMLTLESSTALVAKCQKG